MLVHELDDAGEYDIAIGSGNSIDDARAEQVTRGLETVLGRDDELVAGVVRVVLNLLDLREEEEAQNQGVVGHNELGCFRLGVGTENDIAGRDQREGRRVCLPFLLIA